MKRLLFILTFYLISGVCFAQNSKPVGAVQLPTYSFQYRDADSTVSMFKGLKLYNEFWSRQDTSKLKSLMTKWYGRKYLFLRSDTTLNAGPHTNYMSRVTTDNATNAALFLIFTSSSSGQYLAKVSTNLQFNPYYGNLALGGVYQGAAISVTNYLQITSTPKIYLGSDPGTAGQVITSGGSGSGAYWGTPSGGSMTYPSGSGIPIVVSGTSWGSTITNNSSNWNTAYGWGNWASNFGTSAGTIAQGNHTHSIYLAKNADDTSTGNITAVNFILSSDSTLKSNIRPISFAGIEKVQWVNFEVKNKLGVNRAGVIAQELEKIYPDFVYVDDNGKKAVAYIDLLITKIAELESRVKILEQTTKKKNTWKAEQCKIDLP